MRQTIDSNVPKIVRIGASVFAGLVLTPLIVGFLVPFAIVLAPLATIAIPIIAVGLRGDATGKPSARQVLAAPLPPVRKIAPVPLCGVGEGLTPCNATTTA